METAAERGIEEVGFTEHLYRCVESESVLGRWWESDPNDAVRHHSAKWVPEDRTLSLDAYVEAVIEAQLRGLPVVLGLEVDFFPETVDAVLDLLAPYPWDFLIGSVHWIGAFSLDHEGAIDEFDRRGVDRTYEEYFALETALAASGAVDVLAHADVVKSFGHRPAAAPLELYRSVAQAAAESDTAVEVSSAGLRRSVGEIYPAPAFLGIFCEAGVPITLASDAHHSSICAQDFDTLVAAAAAAGYTERVLFRSRQRIYTPLAMPSLSVEGR